MIRVGLAARKLNITHSAVMDFLKKAGLKDVNVNTKFSDDLFAKLSHANEPSFKIKKDISSLNSSLQKDVSQPKEAPKTSKRSRKPSQKKPQKKSTQSIPQASKTKTLKTTQAPLASSSKHSQTSQELQKKVQKKEPKLSKTINLFRKQEGLKILGKMELPQKPKAPEKKQTQTKPSKPIRKQKQANNQKQHQKTTQEKPQHLSKPAPDNNNKETEEAKETVLITGTGHKKLQGLKVVDKIELEKPAQTQSKAVPKKEKPKSKKDDQKPRPKRKRINISKPKPIPPHKPNPPKPSQKEVDLKFRQTIAKVQMQKAKNLRSSARKYRRKYRHEKRQQYHLKQESNQNKKRIIRVNEFIQLSDLANIMNVQTNSLITTCLNMGLIVTINHRLDKETIEILAAEFNYEVAFETILEEQTLFRQENDCPKDIRHRSPIVTVMGHVDHGKTSLLDYIRNTKVADFEQGGITQHIGSYEAYTKDKQRIVFLDTPGHEAFTSMRARGAQVTDIAIIVIAADDGIKPRTTEAISHAQIASVPIIFAINKIDKPAANVDKVKEQLSNQDILVESWGGKFPAFEVSAKTGKGIDDLLEGILLEAEVLELKANPNKRALGVVIESSLDKGRGYVSNMLVQTGTMRIGDVILAGPYYGKVKAILNHQGRNLTKAGPATPVQILGLSGAPQAGEKFYVLSTEKEAKEIASKREQLKRAQTIRATRRLTLADIGNRIAQGNFQELNIILKGDVDGSIEALVNLLLKLSNKEVSVRIIHKAVGTINESDVMLASASGAIIIGFHVRPVPSAKALAEKEAVEIRLYSVIYNIIDDVKLAIEGLLKPTVEEHIIGRVEVREIFKTKGSKIAGAYVSEGYIKRNSSIRLIRDNQKIYDGFLNSLRRIKDDVSEVKMGFECGLTIKDFNDIKVDDYIEVYEKVEVKTQLANL